MHFPPRTFRFAHDAEARTVSSEKAKPAGAAKAAHHIGYLDGLRGVAALVVVFQHYLLAFYPAFYYADAPSRLSIGGATESFVAITPLNVLYNGNFAVCVFFVLSGFVLSYKFFKTRNATIVASYAARRYVRLAVPVFASVMFVFALLKASLLFHREAEAITGSQWLSELWQINPSFIGAVRYGALSVFLNKDGSFNTVLWTMSYEMFGSYLVFALILLVSNVRNRFWLYAALCIILHWLSRDYYIAFVAGAALCDASVNEPFFNRLRNPLFTGMLLVAGLYLGSYPMKLATVGTVYAPLASLKLADGEVVFHVVGAICMLAVFLTSSRVQRLFSRKVFLFLGNISFSLYLLHVPILGSLGCYVFLQLVPYFSFFAAVFISILVSAVAALGSAVLMTKYVDRAAVRLSQTIDQRFFSRASH